MDLKEKVQRVLNSDGYEFDITDLIPIPCNRAYICMGENKDKNNVTIYSNTWIPKKDFEEYLYDKISVIENQLKTGNLSLDTQTVVLEFDNGTYLIVDSSEWLNIWFERD